jgi:hypothetical protein
MQRSEWNFQTTLDENDEQNVAWMDQFGVRTALVVLCIGFFIAAIWLVSRPSFELQRAGKRNRAQCVF